MEVNLAVRLIDRVGGIQQIAYKRNGVPVVHHAGEDDSVHEDGKYRCLARHENAVAARGEGQ